MGTPYEEISENYTNRGAVKTDANLAQDTLQLGGLDAEEYATKKYVRDYVNNKEENINNRTDELMEQAKEDLKGYTDIAISNQDFTNFARKSDVAAAVNNMKDHCAESCANSLNAAKQYTDNAINNVNTNINNIRNNITNINNNISNMQSDINSINGDVSNINESISELDGKYDELFQSVSNGKSKIAEAITDKGVYTSAIDTFQNMANNIEQIQTGSDIDTSDATITPDTVRNGYIGYGRNGVRVVGTYIPDESGGGTDTSDATATSDKIIKGYTAYARGEKITGTYEPSSETIVINPVEEIYRIDPEEIPTQSTITHYNAVHTNDIEVNEDYIIKAYSSGGANRIGVLKEYADSIEDPSSYSEALVYNYTYSSLGISNDINCIKLSKVPSKFGYGNNTKLLFVASQYDGSFIRQYIEFHVYSFNTARFKNYKGGEIGIENSDDYPMSMNKHYSTTLRIYTGYEISWGSNYELKRIFVPETISDQVAIVTGQLIIIMGLVKDENQNIVLKELQRYTCSNVVPNFKNVFATYEADDKFIRISNSGTNFDHLFVLNNGLIYKEITYPSDIDTSIGRHIAVTHDGKYCIINFKLYAFDDDYNLTRVGNNYCCPIVPIDYSWISYDGQFLYVEKIGSNNMGTVGIYQIAYSDSETGKGIESFDIPVCNTSSYYTNVAYSSPPIIYPMSFYAVAGGGLSRIYKFSYDEQGKTLIAVIYNGQTFYKEGYGAGEYNSSNGNFTEGGGEGRRWSVGMGGR